MKSLENLGGVCGRTVYRLTLVSGFNLSDAEGYADLVRIGNPDFIEVKGVTYCGTSNNAELRLILIITDITFSGVLEHLHSLFNIGVL